MSSTNLHTENTIIVQSFPRAFAFHASQRWYMDTQGRENLKNCHAVLYKWNLLKLATLQTLLSEPANESREGKRERHARNKFPSLPRYKWANLEREKPRILSTFSRRVLLHRLRAKDDRVCKTKRGKRLGRLSCCSHLLRVRLIYAGIVGVLVERRFLPERFFLVSAPDAWQLSKQTGKQWRLSKRKPAHCETMDCSITFSCTVPANGNWIFLSSRIGNQFEARCCFQEIHLLQRASQL